MGAGITWKRAFEFPILDNNLDLAQRMRGAFGTPAPYGHEPINLPSVGFAMDIVGGSVGSLCESYRESTRVDKAGHWVNLLFDHETSEIQVESPYTNSTLRVRIKRPGPLFVRIPTCIRFCLKNR